MALFMKQDFSPPILSRKWIAMKFRPNMLIYSREHIISILESGLLFREDSVQVEQEAPSPETVSARAGGRWLTRGEQSVVVVVVAGLLIVSPPKNFQRSTILKLSAYSLVPAVIRTAHRSYCSGELVPLLNIMRDYTTLARRAAACCREHTVVGVGLESVSSSVSSTLSLLCRQQTDLSQLMCRASSAVLGSAPWVRGDLPPPGEGSLVKIHHGFLVVQSTLLKYIALAHFIPTLHAFKMYRNHNERMYWLHNTLMHHLLLEFKENYGALERMYRLLKNYGTRDCESAVKKPGSAINSWLYSDVHAGIARSCMEMKLALDKATHLDMFLDSCALNKQNLDLDVLDRDIDEIIDNVSKCLSTVQNSQIRLKKMQNKLQSEELMKDEEEYEETEKILNIEDREPEVRDEVFYCVKTDDDRSDSPVGDIMTVPGEKEKENSMVVLKELKRKLVKREDLMRERERQALAKTMPELKNVPEFPRQIQYEEFVDRKGFISKLDRKKRKKTKRSNRKIDYEIKINKMDVLQLLDVDALDKFDQNPIMVRRFRSKYFLSQKRCIPTCNSSPSGYISDLEESKENYGGEELYKYRVAKEELETDKSRVFKEELDRDKSRVSKEELDRDKSRVFKEELDRDKSRVFKEELDRDKSRVSKEELDRDKSRVSKEEIDRDKSRVSKEELDTDKYRVSREELESSDSDFENIYSSKMALLNDVRRHRAMRKKNFPAKIPSIDNVDEGLKPIEYSFGTGMAMASVLRLNTNIRQMQEDVFIGDGEVSNDSGNDDDD